MSNLLERQWANLPDSEPLQAPEAENEHPEAFLALEAMISGQSRPKQVVQEAGLLEAISRAVNDPAREVSDSAMRMLFKAMSYWGANGDRKEFGDIVRQWVRNQFENGDGERAMEVIFEEDTAHDYGQMFIDTIDAYPEEAFRLCKSHAEVHVRILAAHSVGGHFFLTWMESIERKVEDGNLDGISELGYHCAKSFKESDELARALVGRLIDQLSRNEDLVMLDAGCRMGTLDVLLAIESRAKTRKEYADEKAVLSERVERDLRAGLANEATREAAAEGYGHCAKLVQDLLVQLERGLKEEHEVYPQVDMCASPVRELMRKAELPDRKLWSRWEAASGKFGSDLRGPGDGLRRNVRHLAELCAINPEIPAALYSEFGISTFGRYPVDLLLEQYERKDDLAVGAVPVILAIDDHNSAFYHDESLYADLRAQLREIENQGGAETVIRFMEFSHPVECLRRIAQYRKKYSVKAPFAIMGAHGSETGMSTGGGGWIKLDDLRAPSGGITGMLREDATILLSSCSTAREEGGVADLLSQALGVTVVGPTDPTSPERIQLRAKGDGGIIAGVKYSEDVPARAFGPSISSEEEGLAEARRRIAEA